MRSDRDLHDDQEQARAEDVRDRQLRRNYHRVDDHERALEDQWLDDAAQNPFAGYVTPTGAATNWDGDTRLVRSAGADERDQWSGDDAA